LARKTAAIKGDGTGPELVKTMKVLKACDAKMN
jgi:isocitrate/isopropylmalate dehydrogenase